jgi:transposase
MTVVGLDVHARSTHGAAIDLLSGELHRARFGAGVEPVLGWPVVVPPDWLEAIRHLARA